MRKTRKNKDARKLAGFDIPGEPELYDTVCVTRMAARILADGIACRLRECRDSEDIFRVLAYVPALETAAQALMAAEVVYYGKHPDATTRLERQLIARKRKRKS